MAILAILGPAFISVMIRYRQGKYEKLPKMVIEYGIYAFIITLLTQMLITYILRIPDVTQEALESFPLFTKYSFLAIAISTIIPLLQALAEKYVKISVEVGVYDETGKSEEKSNNQNN